MQTSRQMDAKIDRHVCGELPIRLFLSIEQKEPEWKLAAVNVNLC